MPPFEKPVNTPAQLSKTPQKRRTIAELYPNLSAAEQAEAEYNLRRYIRLVWRIFDRLMRENPELLTEALKAARLKEFKQSRNRSRYTAPL